MPRKARRIYRREHYPIVSRGNDRQKLFREKEDFEFYLQQAERYKVSVFCTLIAEKCASSAHFLKKLLFEIA